MGWWNGVPPARDEVLPLRILKMLQAPSVEHPYRELFLCHLHGEGKWHSQLSSAGKCMENLDKATAATCAWISWAAGRAQRAGNTTTSTQRAAHPISDAPILISPKKTTFLLLNPDQVPQWDAKKPFICLLISFVNVFSLFFSYQERIQIENGTLLIPMLNLSDSGLYQCVAENKYDTIYANAELRVIGE